MKTVIREMTEFALGAENVSGLAGATQEFGREALAVVIFNVLGWLRGRGVYRTKSKSGLRVPSSATWSRDLQRLIAINEEFGQLFQCVDCELNYRDNLLDEERREIEAFVAGAYRPKVRT